MRPRQFLGQRKNAEMSFHTYPRGANHHTQKCYVRCAPTFLFGAKARPQKCYYRCTPREGPPIGRRNAIRAAPFPTNYRGHCENAEMSRHCCPKGKVMEGSQKCHQSSASPNQSQGVTLFAQKCHRKPAPTEFGPFSSRRNATNVAPNNQRPLKLRNNANSRSPRNIKRKTNGQEI